MSGQTWRMGQHLLVLACALHTYECVRHVATCLCLGIISTSTYVRVRAVHMTCDSLHEWGISLSPVMDMLTQLHAGSCRKAPKAPISRDVRRGSGRDSK
jgi:hypothetical protein